MDAPQLETRQLRYFLAVAEYGTFTKAADELHIAQPSLSQAIAKLESQLGLPLFHRVGRRVVLSEAGRDLLEPCRRALRTMQAAEDAVLGNRQAHRGRLVIATMPSPGISPGAELVAAFTARHPGATVSVVAGWTAEEVTAMVKQGIVEVGLIAAARLRREKDLVVVPLGAQPLVLVSQAPGPHPERHELALADLAGCRLITSHPGSVMRQLVDDLLADQPDTVIACEVDHRTMILPLVHAGTGEAVLPASWTDLAARSGLRVRPVTDAPRMWTAAVCRTSGLTPLATDFLQTISQVKADT
ncbi:DNA-binding transcriptional LysR family regulator [Kineosphaera limosa]|uniref:Putative LysR family transcriptional regulator n=1 Tax=Kineosphaera limosa NBRC 100340 TaxID=1184609 RepID=K6WZJ0_9MICO|nr:LysR family transcriptional regulator [Kineosphaera limosa]NYE00609.1 DNA-binding transcriptional LysR family regulator [Kineosphaera limosa]GAB97537.1 putative LysR family transcriptional regulator [Kineosphaera limosa NBRC 100340]